MLLIAIVYLTTEPSNLR